MGMVVLRSTTPCVAVSSRRRSDLLTVISMVVADTSGATATGILGLPTLLLFSSYIKCKSNKTSSNRRRAGEVENQSRCLRCSDFDLNPSCGESRSGTTDGNVTLGPHSGFGLLSHTFHKHTTGGGLEERPEEWITRWKPIFTRPTARSVY